MKTLNWKSDLLFEEVKKANDYFNSILTKVDQLSTAVNDLKKEVKENSSKISKEVYAGAEVSTKLGEMQILLTEQRPFKKDESVVSFEKFSENHQLTLPFENLNEFKDLEIKLKASDTSIATDLVILLLIYQEIKLGTMHKRRPQNF